MNWLNLNIQTLDSPEVIGASPVERATWLFLLRYCVGQENGGRIANCRPWKDRQWQQVVRVTLREVMTSTELWEWDGDDLVVTHYPAEKEGEVRAKRKLALENGRMGGRPAKTTNVGTEEKPTSVSTSVPTSDISAKPEGEIERERNRKGNISSAASAEGTQTAKQDEAPEMELDESDSQTGDSQTASRRSQTRFPLTDNVAAALRNLYRRREGTPWSAKEHKAAIPLRTVPASQLLDDLGLFAKARDAGWQFYRRDIVTLLNNWNGEVERAGDFMRTEGNPATRRLSAPQQRRPGEPTPEERRAAVREFNEKLNAQHAKQAEEAARLKNGERVTLAAIASVKAALHP